MALFTDIKTILQNLFLQLLFITVLLPLPFRLNALKRFEYIFFILIDHLSYTTVTSPTQQ